MKRRAFIRKNGTFTLLAPFTSLSINPFNSSSQKQKINKPDWLLQMISNNDLGVRSTLERYIDDQSSPYYGAVVDGYEMATAHAITSFLKAGICALVSPESAFYNNQKLLKKLALSCDYFLTLQHEDGTIDLVSTNFHSTPDTGFIVKWLAPVWRLLDESEVEEKESVLTPLKQFLINAGEALKVGGIHTPNHRWVVSSGLTELYKINPDPAYRLRAEEWLEEQIDLDEDGQFQEKSSYIYSSLSDRVLISIARGFDKPELLDYVFKNLKMNLFYIHPNGEIVTEASGRQDNSIIGYLQNYYYPYRYMALKTGDGQFAAACRLIEETSFEKATGFLYYFLEDPTLWKELPVAKPLPIDYAKEFSNSNLMRVRRGPYDASILSGSSVFFTFHKKELMLQGMRFASAFFGKGQFSADAYKVENGKYILTSKLTGPYYQPFPKKNIPGDGVWSNMPRSQRKQSEIQELTNTVTIQEEGDGFLIDIEITGTDNVPVALEMIFRQGGTFSGTVPHEGVEDAVFLKEGMGKYTGNGATINFGPGLYEHKWIAIRGALPKMESPTVYLTGFTPFKHSIKIS
ncbi:hypothetical protein [uncultured Cyclobacterium sp.]|uniref:hypothetical protein n=1 Tax=uncultured Cyclobacterium sp. TaxID=453820 RepID=UPI0030EBF66D|tara:strand:+ start:16744 stop:18465 length:1722 start_codon:yes stop_codon:yes gene_type:complete